MGGGRLFQREGCTPTLPATATIGWDERSGLDDRMSAKRLFLLPRVILLSSWPRNDPIGRLGAAAAVGLFWGAGGNA